MQTLRPSRPSSSSPPKTQRLVDPDYFVSFCMVTCLFFLWAMPNNLNDILIRQFMKSFQISRLQAGFVQSSFYLGYFLFSVPAALILRRCGYRAGLVSGLILYSTGAFLFWPAAYLDGYGYFLVALFVIAAGLAFLETGAGLFHRAAWLFFHFGAAPEFGASIQPSWHHCGSSNRYGLYSFGRRAEFKADCLDESDGGVSSFPPARNYASR